MCVCVLARSELTHKKWLLRSGGGVGEGSEMELWCNRFPHASIDHSTASLLVDVAKPNGKDESRCLLFGRFLDCAVFMISFRITRCGKPLQAQKIGISS